MTRRRLGRFLLMTSTAVLVTAPVRAEPPVVRVGIVLDGPWDRNTEILELFEREMSDLLSGEFDVRFPPEKRYEADFTMPAIQASLQRLLADPGVDIVLAMGPLASNAAAESGALPKPVIAPFVLGGIMGDLPLKDGASGVPNLTYLVIPSMFERDLTAFRDIVAFENLVILFHGAIHETYPGRPARLEAQLRGLGIPEVSLIPVTDTAADALSRIPPDAEAVYLTWLPRLSDRELRALVDGLIEKGIPSFSMFGREDVERGVLAGLVSEGLFDRRARRVALITQRILLGEAPETIPVAMATQQRLSINMATARAIGVSPSWEIINEADLIQEARQDVERRLTLAGVMREAVRVNLDLEAERLAVEVGRQEVGQARGGLLPQIEAGATAALIDEDRAEASFGQTAEQTLSGTVGFTQLLFGEPAWANYRVQGHLQRGREHQLAARRLEISQGAALAYLNVLGALTRERVQKDNLRLTRENLELAQVRASVGTAGPAEVYRWEAEIARSRQELIRANSERNLAEMQLNRLLHRPLEEPFAPQETNLDDPELLLTLTPPFVYVDNRRNFKLLRNYLVMEALEISPELRQLDAAIAAQERLLKSQGLQYYVPSVAVQGKVEKIFDERGAGADGGIDRSGLPPEFRRLFPESPDDLNWQIGLNLSLPLFKGGARYASHRKARRELDRLRAERAAIEEKLEQGVRAALHTAGASYASIRLSREAAEAAAKTLEVVTDAYARGAVSILELLDAQNAARVTEEAAAIATYQFLADYMTVQRSVGRFDVFMSDGEKRGRVERLERFILDGGGTVPTR